MGFRIRLYSVLKAAKKSGEKLTYAEAQTRAASTKNYIAPMEAFISYPKKKADGGTRRIYSFGPVRKAQQEVLKALIIETTPEPQHDYCLPGRRGIHGAICEIRDALLAGTRFWMTTDIRNAFPSVTVEHANTHTYVNRRLLLHVGFYSYTSHIGSTRPELPQGGKHSSYICSAVIDGVLRKLKKPEVVKVTFSDNVAIGATTKANVIFAFQQMKSEFATLKAGSLALHHTVLSVGDQHNGNFTYQGFKGRGGVWFCGYAASLDSTTQCVRIRPNKFAFDKVKPRIQSEFLQPLSDDQLEAVHNELGDAPEDHWLFERVKKGWSNSGFPEWEWHAQTYSHMANSLWRIAETEQAARRSVVAAH
jgi:hypothetical protein